MNKDDAIKAAGTQASLARLLGISKQAVSQWPDKVPQLQQFRLKKIKPRWFYKGGPLHGSQA